MYIAGAYYHKIPYEIVDFGMSKLPNDMKDMITKFYAEYSRKVSYQWRNPDFDQEALIRKVRSGERFI